MPLCVREHAWLPSIVTSIISLQTFVLVIIQDTVSAQVSISTCPVPLHVTVGTSFTLSCNYNHHSFVSWQHPSLGVVSQTTGHVTLHVLDDAAVATLIVSDASPNRDEGRYTCTARSNTGVMVTQSVQAELYHAVRITTPSNQVFMALQGDVATVSLPCAAVNHSQIAWRRAGVSTELRNTSDGHLVVLPDRLVINNVRFSDNGTYECIASNRVGHESILSHLNVHVSAGVTASPVSSMVAEGSPAEFVFTVTGNPLPNVEWYKDTIGDDFRITPSPSHLESVLTDSITSVYHLRFSSVRSQDTGAYICQVGNQFGVPVSAQITLQLSDALGPPQQVRATVVSQTSINVTWSRPDGADMVDSYTVVWQSLSASPRSYVIGGDVLHYVINEGLTRLTQYSVYVYASNSRGKGSDSQRVNVTVDTITGTATSTGEISREGEVRSNSTGTATSTEEISREGEARSNSTVYNESAHPRLIILVIMLTVSILVNLILVIALAISAQSFNRYKCNTDKTVTPIDRHVYDAPCDLQNPVTEIKNSSRQNNVQRVSYPEAGISMSSVLEIPPESVDNCSPDSLNHSASVSTTIESQRDPKNNVGRVGNARFLQEHLLISHNKQPTRSFSSPAMQYSIESSSSSNNMHSINHYDSIQHYEKVQIYERVQQYETVQHCDFTLDNV